jgi:hypothetical protein
MLNQGSLGIATFPPTCVKANQFPSELAMAAADVNLPKVYWAQSPTTLWLTYEIPNAQGLQFTVGENGTTIHFESGASRIHEENLQFALDTELLAPVDPAAEIRPISESRHRVALIKRKPGKWNRPFKTALKETRHFLWPDWDVNNHECSDMDTDVE